MLIPFEPGRIITSPAWRCRQTVEPLARRLHLEIEEKELLYPDGADATDVVGDLTQGNVTVVACTHGEVIAALQEQVASGPTVNFGPDRPREKGSVWALDIVDGRITVATYLAPRRRSRPSGPHPRTRSST
jgi:8-oxo-dGTP diphosphatase